MADIRPLVVIRAPIFCMGVGERMSGGGGDHMCGLPRASLTCH
jgi:hypothetical protein